MHITNYGRAYLNVPVSRVCLPRSYKAVPALWELLHYRRPEPSSSGPLAQKLINTIKFRFFFFLMEQTFTLRSLTFFVLCVYFPLLCPSPAGQPGGGDEEGQQRAEEAVVGHRQHKSYQES